MPSGAENEVWTYGEEVYEICKKYMFLREKMRPYILEVMKEAHEKGAPAMRTLFWNFPEDLKSGEFPTNSAWAAIFWWLPFCMRSREAARFICLRG